MSSAARQHRRSPHDQEAGLANGDRMQQEEFHRKYEAYPDDTKYELIAGTVYMASPLRQPHGAHHFLLNWLLGTYTAETPGVEGLDNATILLDEDNEPQPDLTLRVLSEFGGNTSLTPESYVKGCPNLSAKSPTARGLSICIRRKTPIAKRALESTWFFRLKKVRSPGSISKPDVR